jgi:hypothetical protein
MAPPRHSTALVNIPGLSLLAISLYEVDHIVPLSTGAGMTQATCRGCPRPSTRTRRIAISGYESVPES